MAKYVWDEKKQDYVLESESAKSSGKSYDKYTWDEKKQDYVKNGTFGGTFGVTPVDPEYDRMTYASAAAQDIYDANRFVPSFDKSLTDNIYKIGGAKNISQGNPVRDIAKVAGSSGIWQENLTSGKDFLDMSDDEFNQYIEASKSDAALAAELLPYVIARTGGLDTIDMTGMPKAQQRELGRMGNLSQRDAVYEKLQQNPDQEYYEHNYGEIFGDMSEKEYLDELMAYMRNEKNQNAQQTKYDEWKATADAETAKIQAMPDYDKLNKYVPDGEYLMPDNAFLEGADQYTDENKVTLSAKQYREKVINATLAALVNAGNDQKKLEALQSNIELLPELNNDQYNYEALPYMTDEQRGAFFALYNSGQIDAAKKYLRETLDYGLRKDYVTAGNEQLKADIEDASWWEKALYSAFSVPTNLLNEAQGAVLAAKGAFDPEFLEGVHEYDPMFDATLTGQTIRDEIGQDVAEGAKWAYIPGTDKNAMQMLYNAGMSAADSLANRLIFRGAPGKLATILPTAAMGAGAFNTEYQRSQDYWDSLASGIIESGSEYIPFDIIGSDAIKPAAKVMYNMIAEGLGESSADIINTAYDVIKNGASSEVGQMVDELITQGYTKKDAILQVIKEKGLDVLESGITGAMSGMSAAPKAISEYVSDKRSGTNLLTNEAQYDLADLAETVGVDGQAADIMRRLQAERADKTKGDKAESAIAEKGGVTKADAEAAVREAEMTERDKAERADETKEIAEEDAASVTAEDVEALENAEMNARDKAERADETKGIAEEDAVAVTAEDVEALENAEMNARDKAERAEDGKSVPEQDAASVTAEDVAAVKNKEQSKRDRKENAGKKKGSKAVSKAEIGYLYRETMSKLDKEAQNIVSKNFSRDIRNELDLLGYEGDSKQASEAIARFAMGEIAPETLDILENSKVARDIALSYVGKVDYRNSLYDRAYGIDQRARKDYVKPESTKAEKGAQEATKGIYADEDELEEDAIEMTDDDIDVEIADADESTVGGRTVTIEGMPKVAEDGSMVFTVKDAEGNVTEVSGDDITYGQNDGTVARLAAMAKEMGKNAETMFNMYQDGQSVAQYAEGFKKAMQYGEDGRDLDVIKGYGDLKGLNEAQIEAAYDVGRETRTKRNTMFERKNAAGIKVGHVDTSAINMRALKANQMATVRSMTNIAKAIGFNVKFVESKANAEGKYTTENGSWDPKTLTLTLDVHAGSNSTTDTNYAMIHTAGHELTHYIKQFADGDMWNAYQEFVVGHLSKKDGAEFNLENEITSRMNAEGLTRDAAIVEVIADASGEALNRISEADIQSLAETNPSLMGKIKQFFKQWIGNLKKMISTAYKGTEAKDEVARQMMDAVDEMAKRWNELLLNATKNKNVALEATSAYVIISESGDAAYVDSDTLYSLRTFNESDYVTERAKAAAALAKQMGISQEKAEAYIDDVTSIAAMVAKDRDRLDFEAENEYSALKHNSEYKFTVDFSTLCKKRLLYTGTFDEIQKQMPETALTEDDYIRLRQMMADRGYEVACAFCYVESRRKNNGEIINKFLNTYKEAQKNGGQMELGPSNRRKAFKVEEGFTPNIADFNTSEGIANIMHNHRGVYDAYMYFMNARGVSKPKLIESRTEYTREILDKFRSKSAVKAMNRRGGLILQSFSDFEVVNMLDMMQVVMDMSRVGLMSQAYTKVPAFARVFGGTGVKINLSLVTKGVDKNGKLIFDDVEGMPHEEAFKIRDMYSENVGTILVGKDDATIRAAMADPRIDFIIPYHASGWSTENQNALGIGGYTNFTAGQNETNAATGKGVKNFQPSEYWDYSKTGDENAQTYLKKCREAGRVPKFPQYQNYPGYWKMLIDFKMYDNEGNGSPQRAVRPDFNLSEAGRIMKEYTGGHQNLPVAHDVVRDFVKEYEGKQDRKKYSKRVETWRSQESVDNDAPTDDPDMRYQRRDLSKLTDRDLLVSALETDLKPAERDHLSRYKEKVEQLNKDQRRMEELNAKIVELRNAGFTPKTSEELRTAETNVTTLRKMINRQDAELNKIESAAMIKEVIRRNRKEASKKRTVQLREWQEKEKYKARLEIDTKRLYKFLVSPNKDKSVPEFLRKPVADFIAHIDYRSKRMLNGGEPTRRDMEFAAVLENLRDAIDKLGDQQANIDNDADAFYGYVDLPANYLQNFRDNVKEIKRSLEAGGKHSGTPVERMTAAQLRELSQAMRILSSSITHIHNFLSDGRGTSAKNMADLTINEMTELKARMETNKTLEALRSFDWKNTTPYYAFERLGLGGRAMFERLMNGWDKMAFNSEKVVEYAKSVFNEEESKAWSNEIHAIELDIGETVQMTTAQMMSLYCHNRRNQSRRHLTGDGIRIGNIEGKNGKIIRQVDNYNLTLNDIKKITGMLTARQIEVADKLQSFMSTVCADWGNEISMKRFGFKQMTEEFYIPIETDANNRAKIDESREGGSSMFRLLNMSFLKPLNPEARNAIVIKDIFNVFSDHTSDMAKYNAMALPILDFIKWYNYVEKTDVVRSTQKALEHAYGNDARGYLTTFIKDLNAEHDGGRNDHIINRLTNRAKLASVGANMRVYMLQLTSIPRAAYAINAKYLAQGAARLKAGGDKAADKVGILKWKDLGFFSTDINRNVRTMVKQDESKWDKARNIQMKPAEWGDKLTANIIYNAVKAEMSDKHPEIKAGTATYDAKVNERVREIIYKTQVVDSTMTRSELMRSKGVMSMFTSFMSEPTLTLNMLSESLQEAIYKKRGGKLDENDLTPGKKAAKAWTVFLVGGVVSSLIASIPDAFRDDDEFESWWEKYFGAVKNNAIDAVNIASMIPVIAEAAEAVEAAIKGNDYVSSTLAAQGATSAVATINGLREYYEGKRTLPNVIYSALKALSYSTGLGFYNATRDGIALYNTVIANGTTLPRIQSWRDGKDKAAKAMYKAAMAHDTEEFDKLTARAALYGIEPEDLEGEYNKLISADYLAGDISADDAKRMIKLYGGKTPYQAQTVLDKLDYQKKYGEKFSDVEKNYVSGKTAKADAKAALTQYGEMTASEADAKILTWDYEKATGRKYSDISNAYIRGEMTRNEIKNAMTKYGGKDSGDAESSILHLDYQIKTERPWSELMNDYHKGRFTSGQVKKFLMDYDGKDEYEAEDIVEKYDWAKQHGGSTDGYNKYITVHEAIDSGRDITDAMEALVDKYAARGKSRKDTLSAIRSSVTSRYKPIYLASSEEEQARMREQLLDVYVQLGGKYSTYYKNMTKGWFED